MRKSECGRGFKLKRTFHDFTSLSASEFQLMPAFNGGRSESTPWIPPSMLLLLCDPQKMGKSTVGPAAGDRVIDSRACDDSDDPDLPPLFVEPYELLAAGLDPKKLSMHNLDENNPHARIVSGSSRNSIHRSRSKGRGEGARSTARRAEARNGMRTPSRQVHGRYRAGGRGCEHVHLPYV